MVKKYNRIKSQQHVRLYKVQLISVTYGSVLYSVAFEFAPYYLLQRRPENHGGSVVICSYSMLKVEGSNPRDCALRPLTAGVVSGWIFLFAVG